MEDWSVHHLYQKSEPLLGSDSAKSLQKYAIFLKRKKLPVIFTLGHLSKITNIDYTFLRKTVMRHRENSNYRMFSVKKRSGGWRYIHQATKNLFKAQQFINSEILQKLQPHHASFAFHAKGGIHKCAINHCQARWLFQYDLKDFFYSINEFDVYHVFKNNGYRPLLAFELAKICTTTRLPINSQKYLNRSIALDGYPYKKNYKFYKSKLPLIGVLPQGAPSSPMLSNLVAFSLDESLTNIADKYGLIFTRYADDITFSSAMDFPQKKIIIQIHQDIIQAIRKNNFHENPKKTRIAGPGAKKQVLGLLVDGDTPRISKKMYKRIERLIYATNKFGLINTAQHENFDTPYGLYNHISGLIAYVKDVDSLRWEEFQKKFSTVVFPTTL